MLFRIAEENKQRAAHAFTVERIAHDYGYKKSAMLYPKSNRIMHYYEIDMLDADRIICTVRHKNTDCIVALVLLSGYTPDSIEVDQAELYRNCSNYPYRREYNEKYLKKYDQIACIVHGAIAAGLLFDTVEAPTTEETSEAVQDTTCTDTEPQEGTETAQKTTDRTTDMETFKKAYSAAYSHLYDHAHTPAAKAKSRIYSALFDEKWEQIKDIAKAFCKITGDLLTSDREAAAFMIALEAVGAPTDGETATDGETTTTPETEPQRAAESAEKTADDTTPTAGDTEPQRATETAQKAAGGKSITTTTEGTQEGAQTAGTSEGGNTTTQHQTEPPRTATGGSVSQSDRRTRPAAPQSHESGEGIQRHHRPPKTAYRAIQRAAPFPRRRVTTSHPDRRKVTFSACRTPPPAPRTAPQRPETSTANKTTPETITRHHAPRKRPQDRTRNPQKLPAIIPEPLPAILPHHPATLARMPQDARKEPQPNKHTPATAKARHGAKRKAGTLQPAAAAIPGNVLFPPGCTKPDQIHRKFRGTPFLIGLPARTLSGIFGVYI